MDNLQGKADIKRLYELGMYEEVEKYLDLDFHTYGMDEELVELQKHLMLAGMPWVTVIAIDCSKDYIDEFVEKVYYVNYDIFAIAPEDDMFREVMQKVLECKSEYLCFLEEDKPGSPEKIYKMTKHLIEHEMVDTAVCLQRLIETDGTEICKEDNLIAGIFENSIYEGREILNFCIKNNKTLFGGLSCCMFKRQSFEDKEMLSRLLPYQAKESKLMLLFECMYGMNVGCIDEVLVSRVAQKLEKDKLREDSDTYRKWIFRLADLDCFQGAFAKEEVEVLPRVYAKYIYNLETEVLRQDEIKKELTFFYTDKGEYYNLEPIAKEAEKRGYKTAFTSDLKQSCEIGFYCQHFAFPENAKFSLVLLHDMAQGHNRWPDIWNIEHWDNYDIGIVPGKEWAERWAKCASRHYANPRHGVYNLGYPKGDCANGAELQQKTNQLRKKLNLKYDFTILYAPSWENDGKEDDFVLAFQSMPVNLLIKQADWPNNYSAIINNIREMRKLHEGKYENVYYIEPEESITVALKMCDLIVSDESSVMTEGMLFGKPGIAVYDWLIPDQNPSRFASVPFDYVYKCKKVQLRETGEQLIERIKKGTEPQKVDAFFDNIGNCNSNILDVVDYYLNNLSKCGFKNKEVIPEFMPDYFWN